MESVMSGLRRIEIGIERDETVDLRCTRHCLPRDVAKRIVAIARNVDHAHALAELMR